MNRVSTLSAWVVWVLQGVALLAAGGLLVARPLMAQSLLPGVDAVSELELVELFAPLGLGLGALTLQVLRPSFAWMRPSLASAFFASWCVACVLGLVSGVPWWVTVTALIFAVGNFLYVRQPQTVSTPPSARPNASAEAPMLGRFWALQMLYYLGCGALTLFAPEWVATHLFDTAISTTWATEIHILRFAAALYFTMAIVSHHAIGAQTDETWRGFCQAFLAAQWACAIAMTVALVESPAQSYTSIAAVIVPNVLLGWVNLRSLFDRRWIQRFMDRVRRTLVVWWSLQSLILLLLIYVILIDVAPVIDGLRPAIPAGGERYLAKDVLRLIGPVALGGIALSILAMFRRDRRGQHDFARLFAVLGLVALAMRGFSGPFKGETDQAFYSSVFPYVSHAAVVVIIVNLLIWWFPDWRTADERYQGAADTKPRWVYRLCVQQSLFFGVLAGVTLGAPDWLVHLILKTDPTAVHSSLTRCVRSAAPFWAFMAATSVFAAASANERAWRGLCRWFALWQSVYVVAFVYVFDSHLYQQSVLLLPTLIAILAVLNVRAAATRLDVDDLAGQPKPSGWLMSDAGSGVLMALRTLWRRTRPYHRAGVGATGTFEVASEIEAPQTAFFEARAEPLLCTIRFSNRRQADDATLDYRGCALRLTWPDESAPLDVLMSTGAFGHVSSAAQAIALRWAPRWLRKRWLRQSHAAREASIAGLRRAPDSYAQLQYYTQVVRWWRGRQNGRIEARHCRLRLVPVDFADSGLPDAQDEDAPWQVERRAGESRAPDYLRAEFAARLAVDPVRLRLQVQLSPVGVDDALAWYDAAVDWQLPWTDLGTVVLDRALPGPATEFLRFDPGNGAGVLSTPLSPTWTDPRSLAASQDRVVRWIGNIRMGLYRLTRRRE